MLVVKFKFSINKSFSQLTGTYILAYLRVITSSRIHKKVAV